MTTQFTLYEVNKLNPQDFTRVFADIAELSPWVAERAATMRPFKSISHMVESFTDIVRKADQTAQIALIRAHPDLADKATIAATDDSPSKSEQTSAGLDQLTADEFTHFQNYNAAYVTRFGFPFIFAVKGADKHMILDAFAARMPNSREQEFQTALEQINRIMSFRLHDKVCE